MGLDRVRHDDRRIRHLLTQTDRRVIKVGLVSDNTSQLAVELHAGLAGQAHLRCIFVEAVRAFVSV